MTASIAIDHVVIGVADLAAASQTLDERYGLTAINGGRHPGWGTANRIVPLGASYLELVTVVDPVEAAGSAFGRWVTLMIGGASPPGWAVRTDDIAGTASRLGLDIVESSRQSRTGALLRWQLAGVEQAAAEPALPFFIEWGTGTLLPGGADVTHRSGRAALDQLLIEADPDQVQAWLGANDLPIVVEPGTRGLRSARMVGDGGSVLLELDRAD